MDSGLTPEARREVRAYVAKILFAGMAALGLLNIATWLGLWSTMRDSVDRQVASAADQAAQEWLDKESGALEAQIGQQAAHLRVQLDKLADLLIETGVMKGDLNALKRETDRYREGLERESARLEKLAGALADINKSAIGLTGKEAASRLMQLEALARQLQQESPLAALIRVEAGVAENAAAVIQCQNEIRESRSRLEGIQAQLTDTSNEVERVHARVGGIRMVLGPDQLMASKWTPPKGSSLVCCGIGADGSHFKALAISVPAR